MPRAATFLKIRRQIVSLLLGLVLLALPTSNATPPAHQLGHPRPNSGVPAVLAQDRFLPAQAITAVEVSGEGKKIALATLAFRHDRNFWLLSDQGQNLWNRSVLPWAPYQLATTAQGEAFGVGLAYSRVTAPHPTLSLFSTEQGAETILTDHGGERGWLRYGHGDWRTGWLVSTLGDQFVRVGDGFCTIPTATGTWRQTGAGAATKLPATFPTQRPYRLSASGDGRLLAYGNLVPDVSKLAQGTVPEALRVQGPAALVTLIRADNGRTLGSCLPSDSWPALAPLPDPARDFPDLAAHFALRPDAVLPFRVAASVAVNATGTRTAVLEYAGWLSVRAGPAIGSWNPPYRLIPFVPRQQGRLRILDEAGKELAQAQLPQAGLFEVRLDSAGHMAWCYPAAWFARGMAGCAWLPTDANARTIFPFDVAKKSWATPWAFPDAVSDLSPQPGAAGPVLISCWDGKLYLVNRAGQVQTEVQVESPARLHWQREGRFAVAGTQAGAVVCLDPAGKQRWRVQLPAADLPPPAPLERVFEEVPVYQVGRSGPEHAYVGDTWLIKTAKGGVLIDAGGASSLPHTWQRFQAAGVDLKQVTHLLHTHSHGDHCGAGYLWRTLGLKTVAPASADLALAWLMPTLTDYSVWPPRPVDVPLPLQRAGDETTVVLGDLKVRAIFVPGHTFDAVVYAVELAGKRVVFTGDIGFDNQDILHRCWGDVAKAKAVTEVVRTQVLAWKPDFVFRGHGAKRDGSAFLADLVQRSQEALARAENSKK